jgi:PAS domain-containing protein
MAEYIGRAIFFVLLISVAFYFRKDTEKIKLFNLIIPITFSLSLVMHIFLMKIFDFPSAEAWAFSLTTLFNINQSSVIFFEMPRPVKLPLLVCGFTSIIVNIEKQSQGSETFNGYLYPIMVVYTFFLAKIQCRCKTLKTQLIEELLQKNQNEKNTKRSIMESMQQGVILLGQDNSFLFMNTKIKRMIKLAMD